MLSRILPNRRHDRPMPPNRLPPIATGQGGPTRCATTPSRLTAYGRVARARLGDCRSMWCLTSAADPAKPMAQSVGSSPYNGEVTIMVK